MLKKLVLSPKYNFVFRVLQIAVIGVIMILGKWLPFQNFDFKFHYLKNILKIFRNRAIYIL